MTLTAKAKVAVLVANGFDEINFLKTQKLLTEMDVSVAIISMNQGLVNGWNTNDDMGAWGHNYAVDVQLNSALGVDYDALVIPGGKRSMDKLKMTAHTRRFIGSFMSANKPVVAMDDALDVMTHAQMIEGRNVSDMNEPAQMDKNLLTGKCDEAYYDMMSELFAQESMDQAA